jgi:hypothetical protein
MPDCLGLVRYRTCPGIDSFFYSGTGLFECRTVRHSGIYTHAHEQAPTHAHTYDVQHEHGQKRGRSAWTWTCTMDMEMDKHHGYRNADKKFSPALLVFR